MIVLKNGARSFGGVLRVALSVLAEMFVSALLAPIRMIFHAQFVTAAFAGRSVQWKSPPREDVETAWSEALRRHGGQTLLGIDWVGVVYCLNPTHVWWLLPVAGALILSIPVSVILSRAGLGRRARRAGIFLVPEEVSAPPELEQTASLTRSSAHDIGFVDAVLDRAANAKACAMAPHGHAAGPVRPALQALLRRALLEGPAALSARDRMILLEDVRLLSTLHEAVKTSAEASPAWWQAARPHDPAEPLLRALPTTPAGPEVAARASAPAAAAA
jgi:membrane glycosyltransferase